MRKYYTTISRLLVLVPILLIWAGCNVSESGYYEQKGGTFLASMDSQIDKVWSGKSNYDFLTELDESTFFMMVLSEKKKDGERFSGYIGIVGREQPKLGSNRISGPGRNHDNDQNFYVLDIFDPHPKDNNSGRFVSTEGELFIDHIEDGFISGHFKAKANEKHYDGIKDEKDAWTINLTGKFKAIQSPDNLPIMN